ncbi:MAG: zf-HC2 domain-containing protein [Acidobacteriota bacterium]
MSDCARFRPLLPLDAGGELDRREGAAVRAHLDACPGCRAEASDFSRLVALSRGLGSPGGTLPEPVRAGIAREAARRASREPVWRAWAAALPSAPALLRPLPVAVAGALLLALAALPVAFRSGAPGGGRAERPLTIETAIEGGRVTLAWSDGQKESYTVYKSADPRGFPPREAHVVRGNVWTDPDAGSSPIVYYRIE